MLHEFSREALLLGEDAVTRLRACRVAIFGIGGVGGYVAEALARGGVGQLDLIDNDEVSLTNINRQIIALHSTLGRPKVDVMAERIRDICPETVVRAHRMFYLPETAEQFDFSTYDYVADAIDTVAGKIEIILRAKAAGVPVISAMGAGNKQDPAAFRVADIYSTKVCPLARAMRGMLKKRGVDHLKVVYSEEAPMKPADSDEACAKRQVPGSLSFVPPVVGLIMAGEIIRDLVNGGKSDGERA